jgi:hypothetical protein
VYKKEPVLDFEGALNIAISHVVTFVDTIVLNANMMSDDRIEFAIFDDTRSTSSVNTELG